MTSTEFLTDLIEHLDAEARVSALDEISRAAPQVPRALIAAALDGDIPAALEAVDIAFPGHGVALYKGQDSPGSSFFFAGFWQIRDHTGNEDPSPLIGPETNSGLAQALMLALYNAATTAPNEDIREISPAPAPAAHSGDDQKSPYECRHEIAAMVGLKAMRCALPDGEKTPDILKAAVLMVADVLIGTMRPEHAEAAVAEFEDAVRDRVSRRLTADVAGHA